MAYPGDGDNDLDEFEGEGGQQPWAGEEQLALADEDEDLPWLEADEYEEEGSFDWRLIVYAVLGLVVVGAVLAAAWWYFRDRADPEFVADGSTIEAPEGPYKQRPDDPGGRQVAGTGDQAFGVAEGESTRGRMGDGNVDDGADNGADDGADSGDARSSVDREQAGSSDDESGAVYVQIGAYSSRAEAEQGWSRQAQRFSALSGMRHRVREADVNGATVYRLQAISGDRASADATCRAIRNAGGDCYIR